MRRSVLFAFAVTWLALGQTRPAPAQNRGFQVNRYEPTAAGEWSFSVDHPVYSSTRPLAVGLSLNYAHAPLVFGYRSLDGTFAQEGAVLAHQLLAHLDLAGSFRDRVLLTLSLPITLFENGRAAYGIAAAGAAVGDPRLGGKVRIYGQPYRSAFSISIGGEIWVPWRQFFPDDIPSTSSDTFVRGLPKLVLGGLSNKVLWSLTGGVLLRSHSTLGDPALGAESNSELQLGAAIAYANTNIRFAIGPEVVASTAILGDNAFKVSTTNVEALLGKIKAQVPSSGNRVEFDDRIDRFASDPCLDRPAQGFPEFTDPVGPDAQPGRSRMSPEGLQHLRSLTQRGVKIQTRNRSRRPASVFTVERNDYRRPPFRLDQPRSDDADDPGMPALPRHDERREVLPQLPELYPRSAFDLTLHPPPFGVGSGELFRNLFSPFR